MQQLEDLICYFLSGDHLYVFLWCFLIGNNRHNHSKRWIQQTEQTNLNSVFKFFLYHTNLLIGSASIKWKRHTFKRGFLLACPNLKDVKVSRQPKLVSSIISENRALSFVLSSSLVCFYVIAQIMAKQMWNILYLARNRILHFRSLAEITWIHPAAGCQTS